MDDLLLRWLYFHTVYRSALAHLQVYSMVRVFLHCFYTGYRNENVECLMGPVMGGYLQPVQDKLNIPPRWQPGNYRLTAGKWPSPNLIANLMDLSTYNGYYIMVMAAEWNEEVISQAKIIGVLSPIAGDMVAKFSHENLQEKDNEIASYVAGFSN